MIFDSLSEMRFTYSAFSFGDQAILSAASPSTVLGRRSFEELELFWGRQSLCSMDIHKISIITACGCLFGFVRKKTQPTQEGLNGKGGFQCAPPFSGWGENREEKYINPRPTPTHVRVGSSRMHLMHGNVVLAADLI